MFEAQLLPKNLLSRLNDYHQKNLQGCKLVKQG